MRSTFFRTVESTSAKRRMKRPLKQVGNRLLFQKSQNEINNSSCIQRFYSFSAARGRQQGEALRPDSPPDLLLDLPNRRLRPGALRRPLGLRNFSSVSIRLPTVQSKTEKSFFPLRLSAQLLSYLIPLATIATNFGKLRSLVRICAEDVWSTSRCCGDDSVENNQVQPNAEETSKY